VEEDRRVKVRLYARSGIADAWLVDLEQHTIAVYRDPTPEGYRSARVARRGEDLAPAAFPDRTFPGAGLLPE
jgi:Uma2 family endonuclease